MQQHIKAEPRQTELHEAQPEACHYTTDKQQHHDNGYNVAQFVVISHENRSVFVDILQHMVFVQHQRFTEKVFNDAVRSR